MKVCEAYQVDEDELHLLAQEKHYFENVEKFWNRVKDFSVERLSSREVDWLIKIPDHIESAVEAAREKAAR